MNAASPIRSGGRPTRQESKDRIERLLAIAQRLFLGSGYRDTSLDRIAREAGVAKKTLYHHFGGKAGLFTAIAEKLRNDWIAELRDIVLVSGPPEAVLEAAALHLLDVGTRAEMVAFHRLFVVEAHRFPALVCSTYDEDGALRGMEPLLSYFREAVAAGVLHIADVSLATEQFTFLVLGGPRSRLLLSGRARPGERERAHMARQAVRIFLAGCMPR